jgi:hypothetical protein
MRDIPYSHLWDTWRVRDVGCVPGPALEVLGLEGFADTGPNGCRILASARQRAFS